MSADGVRVRPARPDDDQALLVLDRVSWTPTAGFPSLNERKRDTFFDEDHLVDQYIVAEYHGELAGYVLVRPAYPMPEAAHVFGIHGIVVTPELRGHGVGGALLRAAEERARSLGGRKLKLGVFATNPRAVRLYERHGFVVEGRHLAEFLIDGQYVDDFTMAKPL